MSRQKMTLSAIASAIVFTVAFAAGPASADFIFSLDSLNIGGFTGPYATVDVHLTDSTHAQITFTSLENVLGNEYLLGSNGAVAVNAHGAATISGMTGTNDGTGFSGVSPGDLTDGGSGNEDGFGSFSNTVNNFDSYSHAWDLISFTLTKSSGSWLSDTDVLTANGSGHLAAAHIIVSPDENFIPGRGALNTGFATGDGTVPPPPPFLVMEPHSVALFGLVVLGFGIGCTQISLARRRKAQPQSA